MPTYIAKEKGYLNGQGVIKKGEKFDYDGKPGSWMTPIKEAKKEPEKTEAQKVKEHTEKSGLMGAEITDAPPVQPSEETPKPKSKGKMK